VSMLTVDRVGVNPLPLVKGLEFIITRSGRGYRSGEYKMSVKVHAGVVACA